MQSYRPPIKTIYKTMLVLEKSEKTVIVFGDCFINTQVWKTLNNINIVCLLQSQFE